MGQWRLSIAHGWAEACGAMQTDGPVDGCPKWTDGPTLGQQCTWMGRWMCGRGGRVGRGMVSNADGWAGGWVSQVDGWAGGCSSIADGWAEAWWAMHTDGPVGMPVHCKWVGRVMVSDADGWAGGWVSQVDGWAGGCLSIAHGWAEAWGEMQMDGPGAGLPARRMGRWMPIHCTRVGRGMGRNADGWARGWAPS